MNKFALAVALVMMLSMLASAENDSVTTGPYKVSFDLGFPKGTYNITVMPPTKSEQLSGTSNSYDITIKNNTGPLIKFKIGITQNKQISLIELLSPIDAATTMQNAITKTMKGWGFENIVASTREIDNTTGAIGSGYDATSGWTPYLATYYLSHEGLVAIYSTYPWEHGTLQLLKTIHVEKIAGKK
jgi:hypothetical protein